MSGNFEKGESFPSLMKIFVGYDSREDIAFKTCKQSILDASKYPNSVEVIPLKINDLRKTGIYEREEDSYSQYITYSTALSLSYASLGLLGLFLTFLKLTYVPIFIILISCLLVLFLIDFYRKKI